MDNEKIQPSSKQDLLWGFVFLMVSRSLGQRSTAN